MLAGGLDKMVRPLDRCTDDHFIIKYIGSASRSAEHERRMTSGCDRGVRTEDQSDCNLSRNKKVLLKEADEKEDQAWTLEHF